MSHSTVLVIGENYEGLLEPFDENMEVDPHWEIEYESPGAYQLTADWITTGKLPANPSMEQFMEVYLTVNDYLSTEDRDNFRVNNGALERRTTYNPQSRWDWYTVGGRWRGSLKLKPGLTAADLDDAHLEPPHWSETMGGNKPEELAENSVDQARKGDLDIEGMRDEAGQRGLEHWEQFIEVYKIYGPFPVWNQVRESHQDIKDARAAYNAHFGIRELEKRGLTGFMNGWEELYMNHTKDSFIKEARDQAIPGFAMLSEKTGWIEAGQMGWWGITRNETPESKSDYLRVANRIIDEADDGELFTVVDVHI